jgi:hypothetical protein
MIPTIKKTNLLILRGVYPRHFKPQFDIIARRNQISTGLDLQNQHLQEPYLQNLQNSQNPQNPQQSDHFEQSDHSTCRVSDVISETSIQTTEMLIEMPKKFIGVDSWIKFSNLKCWECDLLPVSYPTFIPANPERTLNGPICDVVGHFCIWNCAVRYVMREYPKEQQPDILESIALFESLFTGIRRQIIKPSPPKTKRREYCGKNGITVAQWREELAQLNTEYSLTHYKMQHCGDRRHQSIPE